MKHITLTCALALLLLGCRDTQKQPAARKVDTLSTKAAAADTAPEMPAGFKSIHQLELEAHPDTAADSSATRRPGR